MWTLSFQIGDDQVLAIAEVAAAADPQHGVIAAGGRQALA